MWNQNSFTGVDYNNGEFDRFPLGFPGKSSGAWGWVRHMHASPNDWGRAAGVPDTGTAPRVSGNAGTNKKHTVRQCFVDQDLINTIRLTAAREGEQNHRSGGKAAWRRKSRILRLLRFIIPPSHFALGAALHPPTSPA